jgi:hypothetical protein
MSDPFRPARQFDLFPLRLERPAEIPSGAMFSFGGRPHEVVRTFGDDAAAPVIVEEIIETHHALEGQFGLWSAAGVTRAMKDKK